MSGTPPLTPADVGDAGQLADGSTLIRPPKPHRAGKVTVTVVILGIITVWSAIGVHIDLGAIARNWANASATMAKLVQPDYSFFGQTLTALTETVLMAVIATAISSAISLPLCFLASRLTNPRRIWLRAVRFVVNVVRSVPDLLYAAILVSVVGTGALSGVMALVLFDIGIIVKLVSEALDGLDPGPQEAALATGGTYPKANRIAVLPEVMPTYVSQVLFTFELNIRASTVIGLVGAGGLGMLIDNVRTFYQYHYLSLIILEILIMVLIIEFVSAFARKRLAA